MGSGSTPSGLLGTHPVVLSHAHALPLPALALRVEEPVILYGPPKLAPLAALSVVAGFILSGRLGPLHVAWRLATVSPSHVATVSVVALAQNLF
jgi:hypothetical protein